MSNKKIEYSQKDNEGEKLSSLFSIVNDFYLNLHMKIMGKILTTIDASVLDDRQNKNLKDLIRDTFNINEVDNSTLESVFVDYIKRIYIKELNKSKEVINDFIRDREFSTLYSEDYLKEIKEENGIE